MSSRIVLAMVVGMYLGGAGMAASQAAPAVYDPIAPRSKVRVTLVPSTGSEVVEGSWVGRGSHEFMILTGGRDEQVRQFTRDEVAQLEVGMGGNGAEFVGMAMGGLIGLGIGSGLSGDEDGMWENFAQGMVPVLLGMGLGAAVGHQFGRMKWRVVEW